MKRKELRSLFLDPFNAPGDRYFTLAARLFGMA
jgi:hypothetical protein